MISAIPAGMLEPFDVDVIQCDSQHEDSWDYFVSSSPEATFYHRFRWKYVIEKSFNHRTYYIMAVNGSEVLGVLPLIHLKGILFGSILCSMPYLNFGGVCACRSSVARRLLDKARELTQSLKADYLELRHQNRLSDVPFKDHKVSMTIELNAKPEALWNKFKGKHRTNIRRAEKNGLSIRSGGEELLHDFYHLISIGWRDLGTPIYRRNFFRNILDLFKSDIEIFVVYYKDKPIATAFNGLFRDTVEGMWTYALKEYSHLQTNYFLYWKMIAKACLDGYRRFHLGRSSKQTNAVLFKSKWNAEPKQLYWEYILNRKKELPNLTVDNPRFHLAQGIWRRLPVPITQFAGPFVSKYIP